MTRSRKYPRTPTPCTGCGKVSRRSRDLCAVCLGYVSNALTDGCWTLHPTRRVMVWVERRTLALVPASTDRWSPAEAARRAAEERALPEAEALRAHLAYKRGDRGIWAVVGHRVYCRRTWRVRSAKVAS